jgi:hypothetical protein
VGGDEMGEGRMKATVMAMEENSKERNCRVRGRWKELTLTQLYS